MVGFDLFATITFTTAAAFAVASIATRAVSAMTYTHEVVIWVPASVTLQ
jgi:hypothetical protein